MQAFLDFLVKGLVSHPEAVSVTEVPKEGMTIYEVRMHADDVGKVIGRQGITINAIRSLLLAGSAKRGLRCTMEIVEDGPQGERKPNRGGDRDRDQDKGEERS
jgi:uncharacterized protein